MFVGFVALGASADLASAQTSDSDVLYRVNAGDGTVSAVDDGPDWDGVSASSTTYFNGDASGDTPSGSSPSSIDSSVPSSTPDQVFVNEIGDPPGGEEMQWEFDVPSGTEVEVRLYLADEHANDRSFDVELEGSSVLTNYDPNDDVGHNVGTMKSFTTTSDGTVDIDFFHGSNADDTNPFVNAIEIVQKEPTPDTLGISPSSLDYGPTVIDDTNTESVQLTNLGGDGDSAITIQSTSITGTDASAFNDGFDDSGSTTLQPGQSTTIPVTFEPSSAGAKAATLDISHSGTNSPTSVSLTGDASSNIPVGFESSVATTNISSGTALDFGPDGRLYVAQESGIIKAFTIEREGENDYQVTDVEEITAVVDDITNHNDDGSVYTGSDADERQVTGIIVEGTAQNPTIYASSSDPRFNVGGHDSPSESIDTNSGVVSEITWNGSSWNHVQLVRGIARSSEAHSPNGLALNESSDMLYLANGGHTMHGAPGNQFRFLPEYATSAAVLSIDLDQIESMPTGTDADGDPIKYDLPTLQPDKSEAPNDAPWGGLDGRNQGMLTEDAPLQIHSPGYRNPYDVLISEDGQMYASDNGPDGSGGVPVSVQGGCTNGDSSGSFGGPDQLHYIPEEGYYAGHPNPTRASPDVAGLYDPADGAQTKVLDFNESFTPVPFSMANPAECQYEHPSSSEFPDDGSIAEFGASTNGMTEYTASNFGGEMQGDLLIASFDNTVHRIQLTADGTDTTSNTQIFSGFGSIPLDVTAQGDDDKFPGTVWTVRYSSNPEGPGFGGSDGIIAFEPNDYEQTESGTCTGADDPSLDEDNDGYDNADEIDAGTDPCSAASQPADYDNDGTSNLNDPDDDNDGIPDTEDPFAIDDDNGLSMTLPVERNFQAASYPGTILDLGFTGLMTNGTDYADLYESDNIFKGGASQDLVINEVDDGDAGTEANDMKNGFQFGVNTPDENFTVHSVVQDPFPDDSGQTPQGGDDGNQQVGVFLGTGDQDNWSKLVVTAHGGDGGLEFTKEVDGSLEVVDMPQDSAVVGDNKRIDLWMHVDPQNETVTAEYSVDGGQNVTVGTTTIPQSWLDDQQQGMAVGTYSTTNGYATFPATWDFIEVTAEDPESVNQAPSAAFSAVPSAPKTGEDVVFDASASSDDGSIASYEWDLDGDGDTDATGQQVIHNYSTSGDKTVTLTVTDDGGLSDGQTQTFTVSESEDGSPAAGEVVYRVNSGGPAVTPSDGSMTWSADTDSNPSQYRVTEGEVATTTDSVTFDSSVPEGTPEQMFQSHRWDGDDPGDQEWEFPVTAGETYEVRLYFAETSWYGPNGTEADSDEVGPRVFDVEIEGQQVLNDYEIHEDVGHDVGTMKSYTVTPGDGTLDVDLLHVDDDPMTSGIEIVKVDEPSGDQTLAETIAGLNAPENEIDTQALQQAINWWEEDETVPGYGDTISTQELQQLIDIWEEDETVSQPANQSPTASFTANETSVEVGQTVAFDASGSSDADGSIASYAWDFDGDGTTDATGAQATHAFQSAGTYQVELTVTDDDGATDTATETITVSEPGTQTASAQVEITTDNTNGYDTAISGGGGSYGVHITNTGDVAIESVQMDHDAALLPDLVLDPEGKAGDSAGEGFQIYDGVGGTTQTSFAEFHNGVDDDDGWDVQQLNFTDFGPGEMLGYTVDMDPNSIKGASPPGPAVTGGVSGLELSGTVVTIEYSNGETQTTQLFSDGSVAGGQATADSSVHAAPSIDAEGVSLDAAGGAPTYSGAVVADDQQTITASGTPGETVHLLHAESALYVEGNGLSGGYDVDTLEANKVIDVNDPYASAYTATIGQDGTAGIPVTLLNSTEEGGYNYFMAVTEDDQGDTGLTSDVVILKYNPNAATNQEPAASFSYSPSTPETGEEVSFDASASTDQDGSIASYAWDFDGDGQTDATGQQVVHAFESAGEHQVELTVTDDESATDNTTQAVTVTEPVSDLSDVLYRVNAGGPNVSATDEGADWSVDNSSSPSPYHNSGSDAFSYANNPNDYDQVTETTDAVPGYVPLTVFESERGDPPGGPIMEWDFPVEAGKTVDVRLYFADIFSGTSNPGDRQFNVSVEDSQVLTNYDIIQNANGDHKGHMENFTVTSDGTVDIDLAQGSGADDTNPVVQGIEIINVSDDGGDQNAAPTASFTANETSVEVGQTVAFDASASNDDSSIASYEWEFGDDNTDTGAQVTHAFQSAGTYQVNLTVTDDDGVTDSQTVTVTVTEPTQDAQEIFYRLNAGGANVSAVDGGPTWIGVSADDTTYYNGVADSPDRGPANSVDSTVPSSTPDAVFATELGDPPEGPEMQWELDVPAGETVELRLYYADEFSGAPDVRKFDVAIDGTTVEKNYDIVANSGDNVGHMENYTVTSDGTVDIDFFHGPSSADDPNPQVNAIEVVNVSGTDQNEAPNASATANKTSANVGEPIGFDASGSSDSDGSISSYAWDFDGDGTTDATGAQVTHAFQSAGTYQVNLTVTDDDGATDTASVSVAVTEPAQDTVVYRVNAGGSEVAANDGSPAWGGDSGGSPSQYLVNGAETYADSFDITYDSSVPAGTPEALFESERYDGGTLAYEFPVDQNETHEVRLYFAEIGTYGGDYENSSAAPRLFNITIDNQTLVESYEPYEAAGGSRFVGTLETFEVSPDDDTLDVDFEAVNDNAKVSAIEIIEKSEGQSSSS